MYGQFGEVIELAPIEDSLAVGHRVRQDPRPGSRRDQHDVRLQSADLAVRRGDLDPMMCKALHVVAQFAAAVHHGDAVAQQLRADVGGLRPRQRLHPVVDLRQRDLGVLDRDVEPEPVGSSQLGADSRRCDERLRRHAVPQHARPTDSVGVDDGDLCDVGATSRCNECGFIAGGAAADDHDPGSHAFNLAKLSVDRRATGVNL
jgi:hypothetical protein